MKTSIPSLATTLLLSLTIPALAQQPAAPPPPAAAATQPIVFDVVVTRSNKPVPNLKQQDFTVLDNGQPASILLFRPHNLADVPANQVDASTNVIILLDEVNTPYDKANFARQQIQAFLRQNNGILNHPFTLAFFTDNGLQIQTHPSIDGNALASALDEQKQGFRILQQGTQYGGAQRLSLSLDALDNLIATEKSQPGRKLVLWVGPGWSYLSGPQNIQTLGQQQQTLASVIKLSTGLREARITLTSINPLGLAGVGTIGGRYYENFLKPLIDPSKALIATLSLQVLATQSGGRVLFGNDLVQNYLNQAVDDLKAFYTLAIPAIPSTQPIQFHTLDIKLSDPKLKALTRNGYYSQP